MILGGGATARAFAGEPREALGHVQDAIRLTRKDGRSVAPEELNLGEDWALNAVVARSMVGCSTQVYYFLGDAERASKCAQKVVDFGRRIDSPRMHAVEYWRLALALRLQRRWADFAGAVDRMAAFLRERPLPLRELLARAWGAEARAHLGERKSAVGQVATLLAEENLDWCPGVLVSCAHTLIYCEGAGRRDEVSSVFERLESAIERTGALSYTPFLHELRAQLARVCSNEKTCQHERLEAERLWTAMGAHGHIERMAQELDELPTRV